MLELLRGQPLSSGFINLDIIVGLVYEHTTIGTMVVLRLDERIILQKVNIEHCNPSKYGWVTGSG